MDFREEARQAIGRLHSLKEVEAFAKKCFEAGQKTYSSSEIAMAKARAEAMWLTLGDKESFAREAKAKGVLWHEAAEQRDFLLSELQWIRDKCSLASDPVAWTRASRAIKTYSAMGARE